MSRAVGSAIVIALSLGTIVYWFSLRGPAEVEPASPSGAQQSSQSTAASERLCLQRIGKHDVEITVQADCERAGEAELNDSLGVSIETREGRRVATGYDL